MSRRAVGLALWLCAEVIHSNAFAHNDAHHQPGHTVSMTDQQSVRQVMKAQFDRPESPLSVPTVSIEGRYAIASWTQDGRGGAHC